MFDGLRKKLEEFAADVNPFDGGVTGATVRANRNKPAPAQTISAQRQRQQPQFQRPGAMQIGNNNRTQIRPLTMQAPKPVAIQTPKMPTMNQKPEMQTQPKLDVPKAIGGFVKDSVNSVGDSFNTIGNSIATNVHEAGQELSGANAARQREIIGRMKTSMEANRRASVPGPLDPNYRAKMQRTAQGQANIVNTLRGQQQQQLENIRRDNDPVKVGAAGINLLGTVAAPGAGKVAGGITKALSPGIRTSVAKVAGGAAEGGLWGAGFGAATQAQNTGMQTTPGQLRDSALQGAAAGAAFGGAIPAVGAGIRAGTQVAKAIPSRLPNPQQAAQAMERGSTIARRYVPGGTLDPQWEKNRSKVQTDLARAIDDGTDAPVFFGKLNKAKYNQANELLTARGLQPLDSQDLFVHPAVVEKLKRNRVDLDGLTPEQVADVAYSAVHNSKAKVFQSTPEKGNAVKFMKSKTPTRSNDAYVGEFDGAGSLKTAYPGRNKIDTPDGRAVPSSSQASGLASPRQAALSDLQGIPGNIANNGGVVNKHTIPQEFWPLAKIAGRYKTAGNFKKAIEKELAANPNPELQRQVDEAGDLSSFHAVSRASNPVRDIPVTGARSKKVEYAVANTLDSSTNKPSFELIPLDSKKHKLSNGMVVDKKGKSVGSYLAVDEHGQQYAYVEGKPVNITGVLGDINKWGNENKAATDIVRNIEANAPDKHTAQKTIDFTVGYKDQQEAAMKAELSQRRKENLQVENEMLKNLPAGISKDEARFDLASAIEKKADPDQLIQKYGTDYFANWFLPARDHIAKQFEDIFNATNKELERNGYDKIPYRENYITHYQEDPSLWEKVGIGIQELNPLGSSVSSDINPGKTRGGVPDEIVGRTANTGARRKFNPFAQQRKGHDTPTDAFKSLDSYLEPMLMNKYMTSAASRARVVERAFRTNDKANQLKMDEFAQIAGLDEAKKTMGARLAKTHPKYEAGRKSPMVVAWQEYGNRLAGKTNALDRTIIDNGGKAGAAAMDASVKLQGITGASSIPGSTTAALAQVLSLPQTIGRDSPTSVLKAAKDMMTFESKRAGANDPLRKSNFMRARYTDAESKRLSTMRKYTRVASMPMQWVERYSGELSWRSAYHDALSKKMSPEAAIKSADLAAKKTLAGRGIGDRPVMMDSKALGIVTQFGLEVNNMRLQFFRDFTPAQKVKFLLAAGALNYVYQGLTGNAPLPDYIKATTQSVGDFQNKEDDKKDNVGTDALQTGQRFLGESSKFVPGASTMASFLLDDRTKEQVFGKNGDLARFGEPALSKAITTGIDTTKGMVSGDFAKAGLSALGVAPTGAQVKRTIQGADAVNKGYVTDSGDQVTSYVNDKDPTSAPQAVVFGKNALPGQQQANASGFKLSPKESEEFKRLYAVDKEAAKKYFDTKIDIKVKESNRAGTLTNTGFTPKASAADNLSPNTTVALAELEQQKKDRDTKLESSLSEDDYKLSKLSDSERQKLLDSGAVTQEKLDGLDNYVKGKKKELGYATGGKLTKDLPKGLNSVAKSVFEDADVSDRTDEWKKAKTSNKEVKKWLQMIMPNKTDIPEPTNEIALKWAEFKKDQASGKMGKLDEQNKKKSLLRDTFNSQLNEDERDLYTLSKARLQQALDEGMVNQDNIAKAVKVEKQMYDAGIITETTLAKKLGLASYGGKASGGKGGGKGKGGSKGGKGRKKGASFDYKLFGFTPSGQSNSKQLYDMVKSAQIKSGKNKKLKTKTA